MCRCPQRPEEDNGSTGVGITGSYWWMLGNEPRPSEKNNELFLTTEPSLQLALELFFSAD